MQAFLGEAARRRHSRRSSTSSKGTSAASAVTASAGSHERTKSSSSGRLFHSSSRPQKRSSVLKKASNKSLAAEQASPPPSSHNGSPVETKNIDVFAFMEQDDETSSTAIEEEDDENDEVADLQHALGSSVAQSDVPHDAPEHHSPVGYSDLEVHAIAEDEDYDHHGSQPEWAADRARSDTFHSDSGISVHSSTNSSGNDSPVLSYKIPSRPDTADSLTSVPKLRIGSDTFPFQDQHSRRASAARLRRFPAVNSQNKELYGRCPESYYGPTSSSSIPEIETQGVHSLPSAKVQDLPQVTSRSFSSSVSPLKQQVFGSVEMPSPPPFPKPPNSSPSTRRLPSVSSSSPANRKASGYSHLASSISTSTHPSSDAVLRPIYRKFETLNNRILLYLQDEICEMEQDLLELDGAIAQEEDEQRIFKCSASGAEMTAGLPSHPGVGLGKPTVGNGSGNGRSSKRDSRRQEAKFPSHLQWVRRELMGRLAEKVGQYSTFTLFSLQSFRFNEDYP